VSAQAVGLLDNHSQGLQEHDDPAELLNLSVALSEPVGGGTAPVSSGEHKTGRAGHEHVGRIRPVDRLGAPVHETGSVRTEKDLALARVRLGCE